MESLKENEKRDALKDFKMKPPFVFRPNDKMFERSVAFARKLDAAHAHATKMNWRFKNNQVRES